MVPPISPEKSAGKKVGFVLAYLVFAAALTLILTRNFRQAFPSSLINAVLIAAAVTCAGLLLRRAMA